jgi:hypothetical protein
MNDKDKARSSAVAAFMEEKDGGRINSEQLAFLRGYDARDAKMCEWMEWTESGENYATPVTCVGDLHYSPPKFCLYCGGRVQIKEDGEPA